jgi:hypothetical protein
LHFVIDPTVGALEAALDLGFKVTQPRAREVRCPKFGLYFRLFPLWSAKFCFVLNGRPACLIGTFSRPLRYARCF